MHPTTRDSAGPAHDAPDPAVRRARRRFATLAVFSAAYTYLLIVFGGVVRITGSGLGCGDDWPKCHGVWIPTFDLPTFIEWFHRLLAGGLVVPFAAMLWLAASRRAEPGFGGRGGLLRPAGWMMGLLVVQALLGALTVKLELPASVTAMHFGAANLLLAIVLVAAIRAGALGGDAAAGLGAAAAGSAAAGSGADAAADSAGTESAGAPASPAAGAAADAEHRRRRAGRVARAAVAAAVIGFVVVLFGALTANVGKTPGAPGAGPAAWACGVVDGGFWRTIPLCNGRLLPTGGEAGGAGLVHTHWSHRFVAYLLFFHVLGATIAAYRKNAPPAVRRAAAVALGTIVLQIAVAVKLVFLYLPDSLQIAHLAVGVLVWSALVVWATLARRHAALARAPGPVPAPAASTSRVGA